MMFFIVFFLKLFFELQCFIFFSFSSAKALENKWYIIKS